MTARSAAEDRLAAWAQALSAYGYAAAPIWTAHNAWEIPAATRPSSYGAPEVFLEIYEVWREGEDPHGRLVARSHQGAYLEAGKAHAQIIDSDEGAQRVDVGDPSKPAALTVHLHPFGQPNERRVGLPAIVVPAQFIHEIEEIAVKIALP